MVHNNVLQDIEKKHKLKIRAIYDFIKSDKEVQEFVQEQGEKFYDVFLDFRKFVTENYKTCFPTIEAFLKYMKKYNTISAPKSKLTSSKDHKIDLSAKTLKNSLGKAMHKWILFEIEEQNIKNKFIEFAQKKTKGKDKALQLFLKSWNMTRSNYYNTRTNLINKGFLSREIKEEKKNFDFKYKWLQPASKHEEKQRQTKRKCKSIIQEYLEYYFEGRIKTKETIEAFKTLRIPLNASKEEIKSILKKK